MTQLCTKYQRESTAEIKEVLKKSRWILVRNRNELSAEQEERLQTILEICPQLRTVYLLKEEFRNIFEKIHCKQKSARFFDAWIIKARLTGDKYLSKFVNTFRALDLVELLMV